MRVMRRGSFSLDICLSSRRWKAWLICRFAQSTPWIEHGSRWAWEIPGRKQQQIEAFAAAARPAAMPVLDWCGGKGHLGRLLALQWQLGVKQSGD
jgi:hypothetical protein